VKLDFAQAQRAVFDRFGQHFDGVRFGDVGARRPDEAVGIFGLDGFDLFDRRAARQQDGIGDTATLHVNHVCVQPLPQMEVDVEHGAAPFVLRGCQRPQVGARRSGHRRA
jgi:hypothetical protein